MSPEQSRQTIQWYRTPIERSRLTELTRRSDWKALRHSMAFLLIYLSSIAINLILFINGLWTALVVTSILHAVFVDYLGMGAAVHELSHGTVFKTSWLNTFFLRLFSLLSWNNQLHFKESHSRHHRYTYYRQLDFEQREKVVPLTPINVVSWLSFDYRKCWQFVWANVNHAVGNFDVDFFYWCPLLPKTHRKSIGMMWWARLVILFHVAIGVGAALSGLWILVYLVSFSHFFFTFFSHTTGLIQHMGLRGDVPDWRVNSYTVDLGPVLRFLYWNMNYHTEHHMYAAVPFYNLPELRQELAWDLQKPLHGYWTALRHMIEVRREQAKNENFRYEPNFPPTANPPRVSGSTTGGEEVRSLHNED